ncbi:MAG TPA: ankyrin repeat domain-containing protein [Allosphingosinicella sp.]|jgi:ankyrin repeat protein
MVLALAAVPAAGQVSYSDSFSFFKAVKERDGVKVTELVSQPGSTVINLRDRGSGEGALHMVVRGRDVSWLAFLLGKGARPDLQSSRGDTPLTLAAQIGWMEGVEQLLARRASVDLANSRGETALILAAQRRDLPLVRLLLSRRADPKKTDNVAGMSALDYAKQDPRAGAVLKLLEAKVAPAKPVAGPTR